MPTDLKLVADLEFEEAVSALVAQRCSRDLAVEILDYFRPALELDRPDLFASYVEWRAGRAETECNAPELKSAIASLSELGEQVGSSWRTRWSKLVEVAAGSVSHSKIHASASEIDASPQSKLARGYFDRLLAAERREAVELVVNAVDEGLSIRELYIDVFQPVLCEVGRLWEIDSLSVGQEHYCTAVTQATMAQLYPRLFSAKSAGHCLVASSVAGNLHEVGIRMIADLMEIEGWDTHFLGADLPIESVVRALTDRKAEVLALSVTLSSQLSLAAHTIEVIRENEATAGVRVILGGRAFEADPEMARAIGGDAWAPDASSAVAAIVELPAA